jgi:RNA polymerase sigma-70 factor (ECF subfamily)
MQPLPDEQEWIRRAKDGDKEAVGTLYDHYVQSIYQYISYRVDSDTIAEDLTSDVFLRMVVKLSEFEYTGAPFGSWLFRIASNLIADHFRRDHRETPLTMNEVPRRSGDDVLALVTIREEKAILRAALQTLPEEHQTVLIMRFMQGLSHADVAATVGKSVAAVRVVQHRALKALGAILGEEIRNDE